MNILFASMKGGAGKSTLARAMAVALSGNDFSVLLADLDWEQGTTLKWAARRIDADVEPRIWCEPYNSVETCIADGQKYDHVVADLKPRAKANTGELAKQGDLIIIPVGPGENDQFQPAALTYKALERQKGEIAIARIALVGFGSDIEENKAKDYFNGFNVPFLDTAIPERRSYRSYHDRGRAINENLYGNLGDVANDMMDEIKGVMESIDPKLKGKLKSWKLRQAA